MGEYSREADRWIVWTWKAEIRWIIEVPVGFSVAIPGGGAKIRIFEERCKVLSTKEWYYGSPRLIEARDDRSVGVCKLRLTIPGMVVVEMWGEVPGVGGIWWRCRCGEWYRVGGRGRIGL